MMKRLITFTSICLTLNLLMSSCGSVSITKRHHSKGYHISHNNLKHQKDVSNTENEPKHLAQQNNTSENTQKKTQANTSSPDNRSKDLKPLSTKEYEVAEKVKSNQNARTVDKGAHKENALETIESDTKKTPSILKNSTTKVKDAVNSSKEKLSKARSDSGLSLLWIIILVVLILWLLGFIAGLGEIIHLLLVVALILLILWLLGVI